MNLLVCIALAGSGVWQPLSEKPALRVASGGDGALWVAGEGEVQRFTETEGWRVIGRYAPEVKVVGDDDIEVSGDFDDGVLQGLEDRLDAELDGLIEEDADQDDIDAHMMRFAAEPDPDGANPYRLAGMVPTAGGVWVASGSGLFRFGPEGSRRVVEVPPPVYDIAGHQAGGVYCATEWGLYRVSQGGQVEQLIEGKVDQVARVGDEVVFLADFWLFTLDAKGQAALVGLPSGQAKLIVGGEGVLFVATDLVLFRRQSDGGFHLCGGPGEPPARLVVDGDALFVVGESAVYRTTTSCERFERIDGPWPGGVGFYDVTRHIDALWAGTSGGVFVLGRQITDPTLQNAQIRGFRRDIEAMPSLEALVGDAFDSEMISRPGETSFGVRPIIARLLPQVQLRVDTHAYHRETNPTLQSGNRELDLREPRFNWQVTALWTLRFDSIGALFARGETIRAEERTEDEVAPPEDEVALPEDEAVSLVEFASTPEDLDFEDESFELDLDIDPESSRDDDGLGLEVGMASLLTEMRMTKKLRLETIDEIGQLYRERQSLLYRRWHGGARAPAEDVEQELALREIDATLNAYTGGGFTRRLGANANAN